MVIKIKRVYEKPDLAGGRRVLVERLWPRGLTRDQAHLDLWLKDIAPSTELRRWFHHEPAKWKEFQKRYRAELDDKPETWQPLLSAAKAGAVTLLLSAHDPEHNNALVLKTYLEEHGGSGDKKSPAGK